MSDGQRFVEPFRIAYRHEGNQINCYIAPVHTMEGAQLLSTMPKFVLDADQQIWQDWQALMRRAANVTSRKVLGVDIATFTQRPAPEHEKAGHG